MSEYDDEDIRSALQRVDHSASTHGGNYAAGMRNARAIFEKELFGENDS